jgi:hypothetical protein
MTHWISECAHSAEPKKSDQSPRSSFATSERARSMFADVIREAWQTLRLVALPLLGKAINCRELAGAADSARLAPGSREADYRRKSRY